MQVNDFYYKLPPELIARYPLTPRSSSRLLSLNRTTGCLSHRAFRDITRLLEPGDLLVFNDTKVIPARLFGQKETGGKVEILIERLLNERCALALVKASKAPKIGAKIVLTPEVTVEVLQRHGDFFELLFLSDKSLLKILTDIGHMPIPHYMDRADEEFDQERYQTVYAKQPGAVAAPTAGLHFDEALLTELKQQGIEMAFVTLHVGAGTFQPVRVANILDHVMHAEQIDVSKEVCEQVAKTKAQGKKVIAVGTTAVRCLETAAQKGSLQPYTGDTDIFIYPGFQFRCIDAMITNFHLPQSTLLMLVSAFAGHAQAMAAYEVAVAEKYRFYSYGDAMLIG